MSTHGGYPYGASGMVGNPFPVVAVEPPKPEPIRLSTNEAKAVYADDPEMLAFIDRGHEAVVKPESPEYDRAQGVRRQVQRVEREAYREARGAVYERAKVAAEADFQRTREHMREAMERELREELRRELMERVAPRSAQAHDVPAEPAGEPPRSLLATFLRPLLGRQTRSKP